MIRIKRVYDAETSNDGARFLVERLWPRGIKKENLVLEAWLKDAAPSADLRRWFRHDPKKWEEFQRRYQAELETNPNAWKPLVEAAELGDVTLIYSARDTEHNNAIVLMSFLEKHMTSKRRE